MKLKPSTIAATSCRDADLHAGLAQALYGAARFDAGTQRQDARHVHEEPGAGFLQVDRAVVLEHEVADSP